MAQQIENSHREAFDLNGLRNVLADRRDFDPFVSGPIPPTGGTAAGKYLSTHELSKCIKNRQKDRSDGFRTTFAQKIGKIKSCIK
jgi:hypothetical protein